MRTFSIVVIASAVAILICGHALCEEPASPPLPSPGAPENDGLPKANEDKPAAADKPVRLKPDQRRPLHGGAGSAKSFPPDYGRGSEIERQDRRFRSNIRDVDGSIRRINNSLNSIRYRRL
jgi:hypothetical protein